MGLGALCFGLTANKITQGDWMGGGRPPAPAPASAPLNPGGGEEKPSGSMLPLGEAQRRIEGEMNKSGVPVLGTRRSGFTNPPDIAAFEALLEERTATFTQLTGVDPAWGAAAVKCSTFVSQSRGDPVSEALVDATATAFASGDHAKAAEGCHDVATQAWRDSTLYFNMPEAGR